MTRTTGYGRRLPESGPDPLERLLERAEPRELLPIDGPPTVGEQVGFTPLVRADRLAAKLGVAVSVHQEKLSVDAFGKTIEALRREPYTSRAHSLGRYAARFDAARTIQGLVEGVAGTSTT